MDGCFAWNAILNENLRGTEDRPANSWLAGSPSSPSPWLRGWQASPAPGGEPGWVPLCGPPGSSRKQVRASGGAGWMLGLPQEELPSSLRYVCDCVFPGCTYNCLVVDRADTSLRLRCQAIHKTCSSVLTSSTNCVLIHYSHNLSSSINNNNNNNNSSNINTKT